MLIFDAVRTLFYYQQSICTGLVQNLLLCFILFFWLLKRHELLFVHEIESFKLDENGKEDILNVWKNQKQTWKTFEVQIDIYYYTYTSAKYLKIECMCGRCATVKYSRVKIFSFFLLLLVFILIPTKMSCKKNCRAFLKLEFLYEFSEKILIKPFIFNLI